MNFIKNLFKKTATKITALGLVVLFILSIFVFWGWYEKQINKVRGMYYVYKGDKAYKKQTRQEKTVISDEYHLEFLITVKIPFLLFNLKALRDL